MQKKDGVRKKIKEEVIFTYPLIILIILLLVNLALIIYQLKIPVLQISITLFTNPKAVQNYIASFGDLAPAVFLLMQVVQVIVAPIPGQVLAMVGGMMFGLWKGAALSILGGFLGSLVAFKLSQKFGRAIVEKIAGKHDFNFFDDFFEQKGPYAVFLLRLLPILSFDVISYGMGLTKIRFRDYAIATLLGMIPGTVIYTYLGSKYALNPLIVLASSVLIIVLLLLLPAIKSYLITKKKRKSA